MDNEVRYYSAAEASVFVTEHYGMLPEDPESAWHNLYERASEPIKTYIDRWRGYSEVQCLDANVPVRSHGANWVVTVKLRMTTAKGEPAEGIYEIEVGNVRNEMKIVSTTRMS